MCELRVLREVASEKEQCIFKPSLPVAVPTSTVGRAGFSAPSIWFCIYKTWPNIFSEASQRVLLSSRDTLWDCGATTSLSLSSVFLWTSLYLCVCVGGVVCVTEAGLAMHFILWCLCEGFVVCDHG